MNLRTVSKWVLVAGILCIWLVKLVVRPLLPLGEVTGFLMGVAPNFIGAFLVPFAAYWLYTHPRFFNGRLLRFSFCSDPRYVCSFGFVLGAVNEYLQLLPIFGRTFDYNDLFSTILGLILANFCFSSLQRRWSSL